MLRRLSRLLIVVLLLAVVAYAASRMLGGDEDDFDDFDDLDSGFEFQETPVEIDVPASDASTQSNTATEEMAAPARTGKTTGLLNDTAGAAEAAMRSGESGRLIDVTGIGPAYAARLNTIGINSLEDLAHADADNIASQKEVIGGAATVTDWISQARSMHQHGQ
jgi:polyhydroxyalkanoate synthase